MNVDLLLPVISKAVGRDLSPYLNLFYRARAAIGTSLNPTGQKFFIENWPAVVDFMETPAGQKALTQFFNAWGESLKPPSLTSEPPMEVKPE